MKTVSSDAIFFLVLVGILCFFFNSFLSIAMFLRVTEEHLDVEKGKTLGQVDVYLHEERRNFGIKTTPANKFPEFMEEGEFPPFWQVSKSWESWNVICSNFQLVFRQSLSFYSISRRLLWEPEVAFPRRQSLDKLMNIFQGDKDLGQTLTTFWRRQLKEGFKSTHEVAF